VPDGRGARHAVAEKRNRSARNAISATGTAA
jgi:hypothetical protein